VSTLSTGLDTLVATHDITRVLQRYCRAMDRIDAALGYTVWHEDGAADYGPVFKGSGRDFVDWVCEFHRSLAGHSHLIGNVMVDVRGDRAASETYVAVALLAAKDGGYAITNGRGRYLDRWSCRDSVWAIDERRYVHDFDVTRDVDVVIGWGTRDASDPSYELLGPAGAA
jgi:hypothetical protein